METRADNESPRQDSADRLSEDEEWLEELVRRWTEVYKKSMTTLALLTVIDSHGPASIATIIPKFTEATSWTVTERGMYRTLRRLASLGLLDAKEVSVERTGAKRKDFELTELGRAYLTRIGAEVLAVPCRS